MTAGPGDEKAAGGPGCSHLRGSHADREQAIATIRAAFIQGRLTRDELTCGWTWRSGRGPARNWPRPPPTSPPG